MMIKAITSLFLLSLCVHSYANNTEQTLLCYEEKIKAVVPCVLLAKTVKLENKNINNGTLYATNGGFYIEAPLGFVLMGDRFNGVFFKYSEKKWIGFMPVRWRYDISSLPKGYDEIYKIDREICKYFFISI